MWIVVLVAFAAAGLTLFSGFGLGSLLLPAFALVFPIHVAVAATAVVHLLNNLFKAAMLGRYANLRVVLLFALPGAVAALAGAWILYNLSGREALVVWHLGSHACRVTPVGLTVGLLVILFAGFELHPRMKKIAVPPRYLALGGLLSGFLGGLSGHQGALRTTFMVRLGLDKKAFLGTSILSAVVIDVTRIGYYVHMLTRDAQGAAAGDSLVGSWGLLLAGTLAAFLGSFLGRLMIEKVTMEGIRRLVGMLLLLLGLAMTTGLVSQ